MSYVEPDQPILLHPNTGAPLIRQFTIGEWTYGTEEDGGKLWHFLVRGGDVIDIEWCPYSTMTPMQVRGWIALGKPGRQRIAPLNAEDLLHIAIERLLRVTNTPALEISQ